jgi:hypothetical protein
MIQVSLLENYLGMPGGIQSKIAEPEEQIDAVPGIIQQPGVQPGPISLLINYSHEEQALGCHLEADRIIIVFLLKQAARVACTKTETAMTVHRHEGT